MSADTLARRPDAGYVHEALLYRGAEDFLERVGTFLAAGLQAGEPTLVAVDPDKIAGLRERLGAGADGVVFVDMRAAGANPGRIISVWRDFLAAHPGRPVRGVGEPVWAERDPHELAECERHERLLNLACQDSALWLLCPYDETGLPPDALAIAAYGHRELVDGHARRRSDAYRAPEAVLCDERLPEPAGAVSELAFADAVHPVRQAAAGHAADAGLPPQRARDLVLAVSEVAANSLRHGTGTGVFRAWRDSGALVCEIRDAGRLREPLAGRFRPAADALAGRGLWIAQQLCDLVQLRSDGDGTVVRLHMRLG